MKLLLTLVLIISTCTLIAQDNTNHGIIPGNLNLEQTLKFINTRLIKWCEKGNIVTVTSQADGNVRIINKRNSSLVFNLADLTHSRYSQNDKEGIEIQKCDSRSHTPLSWINFNTAKGNAAFIRLQCNTPGTELELIRDAFLQLRSLSSKK